MAGHHAEIALAAGDDDHVDVLAADQFVGRDEFEAEIGHGQSFLSIAASNACAAASNLSRQPGLQKPTT